MRFTRRHFLWVPAAVVASPGGLIAACPTPTSKTSQGPFYKAGAPARSVLREAGMPGTRMMFFGRVLNDQCRPVEGAVIDLWHSNNDGEYDNQGYRLRGQVHTNRVGQFRFETIQPKGYSIGNNQYRCAHFHVKVHMEAKGALTTELYFPGDPLNAKDSAFAESRMVNVENDGTGKAAEFDFVVT